MFLQAEFAHETNSDLQGNAEESRLLMQTDAKSTVCIQDFLAAEVNLKHGLFRSAFCSAFMLIKVIFPGQ